MDSWKARQDRCDAANSRRLLKEPIPNIAYWAEKPTPAATAVPSLASISETKNMVGIATKPILDVSESLR
jgi:hypothetical protein